jgi:hypothetical protein
MTTEAVLSFRAAREKSALEIRVRALEAAIARIEHEAELALSEPRIAFLVTRRVAAIAARTHG